MDFSKTKITEILRSAMPNRFQDFPPSDFEDFIAQLFKDNGYHVKQTSYSGDYGADLIIVKEGKSIAVQVKRYSAGAKVGVKDINQILGARDYYNCEAARVITTSSYTKSGQGLALKTQTELWDWDRLQKSICDTYFGGKDYYRYFKDSSEINTGDRHFEFQVKQIEFFQEMKGVGLCTLIHSDIKNLSNSNVYVALEPPVFISQNNRQIKAVGWYEGSFVKGTVYAGCTVSLGLLFKTDHLSGVSDGDRIIFQLWIGDDGDAITEECKINLKAVKTQGLNPNKKCYFVTMCFGRGSGEYAEMIYFRDNFLNKFRIGRFVIDTYYRQGPLLVVRIENRSFIKTISRIFLKAVLLPVVMHNSWDRLQRGIGDINI